jgi:hypothetical protein
VDGVSSVPTEADRPGELTGADNDGVELTAVDGRVAREPGQRTPAPVKAAVSTTDLTVFSAGGVQVVELPGCPVAPVQAVAGVLAVSREFVAAAADESGDAGVGGEVEEHC